MPFWQGNLPHATRTLIIGEMSETTEGYDVAVIGGGAAGLSGAMTLARARRSVLVIDGGEPPNAPAAAVHGFLTRDGTSPAELLEVGRGRYAGTAHRSEPDRSSRLCAAKMA